MDDFNNFKKKILEATQPLGRIMIGTENSDFDESVGYTIRDQCVDEIWVPTWRFTLNLCRIPISSELVDIIGY